MSFFPWAVHIFDGILTLPWLIGGFILITLLWLVAYLLERQLLKTKNHGWEESEIAQIALLTAAFYVVSSIHVRVGPTTVHLLFNGLLGVILRWRVVVAIPVGLLLQVFFFSHGGFSTLGVNSCILILPALAAWGLFAFLRYLHYRETHSMRFFLVVLCSLIWTTALVYSLVILISNNLLNLQEIDPRYANSVLRNPLIWVGLIGASFLLAYFEPKLGTSTDFPLGLLIGTLTVLLTMLLNFLVLILGTKENFRAIALLTFVAHMPIAVLEGLILGFSLSFLAKVKPEMLRIKKPLKTEEINPNQQSQNLASRER